MLHCYKQNSHHTYIYISYFIVIIISLNNEI